MTKIWDLTKSDFIKGAIVTVISAVLTFAVQLLQTGEPFDFKQILTIASIAFLSYIIKQIGTDEEGKFAGKI